MRTAIALICLVGPTLYFSLQYLRDYGFSFGRANGWGPWQVLALILLLGHVFVTVSGKLGEMLDADFFPFRGFLFFALSGAAYGAAIFPRLIAERSAISEGLAGRERRWLVAIPAWIWISVLVVLAATHYMVYID